MAGGTLTSSLDGPELWGSRNARNKSIHGFIRTMTTNQRSAETMMLTCQFLDSTENAMTLSFNVDYDFPALDPTKGFLESFTYSDDTTVREDIFTPEGIVNEWPMGDANDANGGKVST